MRIKNLNASHQCICRNSAERTQYPKVDSTEIGTPGFYAISFKEHKTVLQERWTLDGSRRRLQVAIALARASQACSIAVIPKVIYIDPQESMTTGKGPHQRKHNLGAHEVL
ncbi:hypothetical protein TNCV_3155001 [Trichonephila clavipes]|nr:hypothetical protein TNCV_3155001 [Trichonephila clavipes]